MIVSGEQTQPLEMSGFIHKTIRKAFLHAIQKVSLRSLRRRRILMIFRTSVNYGDFAFCSGSN